jgi:SAM-dependent methyltransferase
MSMNFTCRSCGDEHGELVLDLGSQPLANNLLNPDDVGKVEPRFPLRIFVCPACWMIQITDTVPPVELFSDYLYFSSFSDTMLKHAQEAVSEHTSDFGLNSDSHVVEIASNDGYLLKNFVAAKIPCLGIEPAQNIAKVAREAGIETLSEFFTEDLARQQSAAGRKADLILGNNVFAHVPDTNDFVAGLAAMLKEDGRIAIEFPYAVELFKGVEFDTIYHEHVFYFSLLALQPLFERHGLEIFRVKRLPIHGGSLRIYAGHAECHAVDPSVTEQLAEERQLGLDQLDYYSSFSARIEKIRTDLRNELKRLREAGHNVAAYGASAKGSTLLNFYGLNSTDLDFVADRSPHKQGKLTPGTHIPIVPPEELIARQPDYTLLLTWNFATEILAQQQAYRDAGGQFIIPLPEVHTV